MSILDAQFQVDSLQDHYNQLHVVNHTPWTGARHMWYRQWCP